MNNRVIVRFSGEELMYEEKMELLTGEVCNAIFPISIMHKGSITTGYYKTSGYRRLSLCDNLTAESVLNIAVRIIEAMEECCQYLIFPEEYVINSNTVYLDERYSKIKFTYIPDIDKLSFAKKFEGILMEMKALTTEEGSLYLDMLIELSGVENLSFLKLKALITRLLRQVHRLDGAQNYF